MTSRAVQTESDASQQPSRRARRTDEGVATLETMLVAPVIFLLVLGIFEFGLVYRDMLTVSNAAGDGARTASVLGPRPTESGVNGDFAILTAVRNSLGSVPVESINRIVIFRAGPPTDGSAVSQVPAACRTFGSQPGVCNVYDPGNAFAALDAGDNSFFECGLGGAACWWPPHQRRNGPRVQDIDYVGVYIRMHRPYITGLFGQSLTLEEAVVFRLEPGVLTQ
jgi:hypothetical protein